MRILVTGGAGYIGSVVTEQLVGQKHSVIVLDNLSKGHKAAVNKESEFIQADLLDPQAVENVFLQHHIDAIMHLAADTVITDSATNPQRVFHNNVVGSVNLLDAMVKHHVDKIVFSSSAAVYGRCDDGVVEERAPKAPINAYGDSKLMFESILARYGEAYGIKHISLRYFNAAGATASLGEDHRPETHLIPNVMKATLSRNPVVVFGGDYPTKDGTCVRDFVHVEDISRAHLLALEKMNELSGRAYNLGNQRGYSVLEVLKKAEDIAQATIPFVIADRRSGDPAVLVASAVLAKQELGWEPVSSGLDTIIRSTLDWMQKHADGYSS